MPPTLKAFLIYYNDDALYQPDFTVETRELKLLGEIKDAGQLDDPVVAAKSRAAVEWCGYASQHAKKYGGKPWRYLLIPGDAMKASPTLAGLLATYGK